MIKKMLMYKKYALVSAIAILLPVISFAQTAPKGSAYVKRADGTYVAYPEGLPKWKAGNEGSYKWDSEKLTEEERAKKKLAKNVPISYPVAVKDLQKFEVLIPDKPTDGKYALQGSYMEPAGGSHIVRSFEGVLQPGTKVTVTDPKTGKTVSMLMEDAYKQGLIKLTGYYNPVSGNVVDVGYDVVAKPVLASKPPVKPSAPKPTFSTPSSDWMPVLPKPRPATAVKPKEVEVLPEPQPVLMMRIKEPSSPNNMRVEVVRCINGACSVVDTQRIELTMGDREAIGKGEIELQDAVQMRMYERTRYEALKTAPLFIRPQTDAFGSNLPKVVPFPEIDLSARAIEK